MRSPFRTCSTTLSRKNFRSSSSVSCKAVRTSSLRVAFASDTVSPLGASSCRRIAGRNRELIPCSLAIWAIRSFVSVPSSRLGSNSTSRFPASSSDTEKAWSPLKAAARPESPRSFLVRKGAASSARWSRSSWGVPSILRSLRYRLTCSSPSELFSYLWATTLAISSSPRGRSEDIHCLRVASSSSGSKNPLLRARESSSVSTCWASSGL